VALLTNLDTWQCTPFRGIGHLLIYSHLQADLGGAAGAHGGAYAIGALPVEEGELVADQPGRPAMRLEFSGPRSQKKLASFPVKLSKSGSENSKRIVRRTGARSGCRPLACASPG
jgi:hypothetical protein